MSAAWMTFVLRSVVLVLRACCVVAVVTSSRPAPDLPADLQDQIVARVADTATLAALHLASRRFHARTVPALQVRALFDVRVPVDRLPDRIRVVLAQVDDWGSPHLARILSRVTPHDALGLYDRLVAAACPLWDKCAVLCRLAQFHTDAYSGVAAVPDVHHVPVVLAAAAAALQAPIAAAETAAIPVQITDLVREIVAELPEPCRVRGLSPQLIEEVRSRYTAPFDGVFPRNGYVSERLLRTLRDRGQARLISDSATVLRLLRHGIRFQFADYILAVDQVRADQVADLYPLLAQPIHIDMSEHLVRILLQLRDRGQHELVYGLLRTPRFLSQARPSLHRLLTAAVNDADTDLVTFLAPYRPEDRPGLSLDQYAPRQATPEDTTPAASGQDDDLRDTVSE